MEYNSLNTSWHAIEASEAAKKLCSDLEKGLDSAEAEKRLLQFGENKITSKKGFNAIKIFYGQFKSFLVVLLIAAAAISFFIGEGLDAGVILAIIILNAMLGFRQEFKAEKAMQALQKLAVPKAIVVRNGKEQAVDSTKIVPGDLIVLREGDRVPADARIIESINLKTNEAILSGESNPAEKQTQKIFETAGIADRKNMLFLSTTIVYGRGKAVATATAMQTEFGKISAALQAIKKEETPLTKNINDFGKKLAIAIVAICIIIFFLGFFAGNNARLMFFTSLSLAVAAVPEGLPAVVTITLALGMKAMAGRNALIRKMSAVETLGSTSVICSDKTGTLTKNELNVEKVFCNNIFFEATGTGFEAEGKILFEKKHVELEKQPELELLLEAAVLCNNAALSENNAVGDPTEIALLALAKKACIEKKSLEKEFVFLGEIPFDSERKRMSSVFESGKGRIVFCKGSVESLLEKSSKIFLEGKEKPLSKKDFQDLMEKNDLLARSGYRVLGLAFNSLSKRSHSLAFESPGKDGTNSIESELVFLGMAAMIDSPREEAREAVQLCQKAGIEVKMITGDHLLTAIAIAKELGIMGQGGTAISGAELEKMSEKELEEKILQISVFARVNPEHKLLIVKALQKKGLTVAMTGDGINDAPALKKADIGIAMGLTGTEASKEASDMVVLDDNFATIVSAVKEGRRIFSNIQNFVKYLLAANTAEVLLILFAIVLEFFFGNRGWPLPLVPVQLLFINLITDGLPAIALGNEPAAKDLMLEKPRKKSQGILHNTISFILVSGIIGAVFTLVSFRIGLMQNIETAQTMAFATIIIFETIIAFNCRGTKNIFQINPFGNKSLVLAAIVSIAALAAIITIPAAGIFLGVKSISAAEWAIAIALALPAMIIPFLEKPLQGKFFRNSNAKSI